MRDVNVIDQLNTCARAHNRTNTIKLTCAKVSVKCNISTECSRIAVKSKFKGLYNHTYYLDTDEVIASEPSLSEFRDVIPRVIIKKLMLNE